MQRVSRESNNTDLSSTANMNGLSDGHQDIIEDDIHHTVGRLFQIPTQGKKEGIEEIVQNALQAERNHWKQRLNMSMQEIDRQHKVTLTLQTGLQVQYTGS